MINLTSTPAQDGNMAEQASMQDDGELSAHRRLMTIMFTDVVDSSLRIGSDEERTLRLIQRDMRFITQLCQQYGGRVLKQLGDGCLAAFDSGVRAIECAQAVQCHFAEQARGLAPRDVLLHRIGLHLGDVYMVDNDVLGDGVNVAARLQSEAAPGGICLSQQLFEVVKGRLARQTVYQGAKHLNKHRRGRASV
jgi:class 3 adenylate cyclase